MKGYGFEECPDIGAESIKDRDIFYSSYVESYINRDVVDMIPGIDKLIFSDFIRATACRAGQMLNAHEIAVDVGLSDDTVKRWLHVLEKSEIIFYLRPYSNNLLKRTIKTPKMYFFDTGLVSLSNEIFKPRYIDERSDTRKLCGIGRRSAPVGNQEGYETWVRDFIEV